MAKGVFSTAIRADIRQRANQCCEYCKSRDKFYPGYFSIDHIVPIALGGDDDAANLAYSCLGCKRMKWKKTTAFDLVSNQEVPLFNPRAQNWAAHFEWGDDYLSLIGLSAIGRATIDSLRLNREKLVEYRREMFEIGQHPPA